MLVPNMHVFCSLALKAGNVLSKWSPPEDDQNLPADARSESRRKRFSWQKGKDQPPRKATGMLNILAIGAGALLVAGTLAAFCLSFWKPKPNQDNSSQTNWNNLNYPPDHHSGHDLGS
jgi:hypothetical protein